MAEHTGGRYRDTGGGPRPLAVVSSSIREGAAQAAYRAYVEHRPGCDPCLGGDTLQCETASQLWDAYRAARG